MNASVSSAHLYWWVSPETCRADGLLSMAAYGDYQNLCPQQTFTEAGLQKTFPGSTAAPWTFLGAFGPTASGMEGFSVIIPAMKKVRPAACSPSKGLEADPFWNQCRSL